MMEHDPYGKSPHEMGAKLDSGKSPVYRGVIGYFPRAIKAVADVSAFGASKYAWGGWQAVPDGVARYSDALGRHITDESVDGPYTRDSGLLHKAHAAWNALAALELYMREQETDGYSKSVGAVAAGNGLISKCVPEPSKTNPSANSGSDLCAAKSSWGSGGAIGGYCKGQTPWDSNGSNGS